MKRFLFLSFLMCGIASGALFAQGLVAENVVNPTGFNYILENDEYVCVSGETDDPQCGSGSTLNCTFTDASGTHQAYTSCDDTQEEGTPILGAIMKRNAN